MVCVLLERRFLEEAIPRILDNLAFKNVSIRLDNLALPEEESPTFTKFLKNI